MDQPVFYSSFEKNFSLGVADFFVSDIISEVVFGPFGVMLHGLGPNR